MSERFAEPGCVLFFYVTASGDVRLGMNGVERGVFLSGVDTSRPLWALFDVYGNATALQLVHERRRSSVSLEPSADAVGAERGPDFEPGGQETEVAPDHSQHAGDRCDDARPDEGPPDATLQPLLLHRLARGGGVSVSSCLTEASRLGPDSQPAYVLGASPLVPGGRLAVRLLAVGEPRAAGLTFGLTSCDPDTLLADELPANPDLLANRAEYWPLVADVVSWPMAGERLTFGLAAGGVVHVQRGTGRPRTLMHVDASLTLWPVLGLTGGVGALRALGLAAGTPTSSPQEQAAAAGGADDAPAAATPQEPQSDCSVCLDRASDAALYACGHVCMCYACAVQWRARGTGLCPVCCAPIRDVIRLYRS
ncbi:protein neuralized-like isoform X2 [Pollicipes pollicipes]|nr:protein neuralized-like isoform X2 [Pollicipes pollicipes]XP_037068412.1 protein neuralized-like isoform X2 [Pollicipes pollicipes]